MLYEAFLVALLGMAICLDRVLLQVMISRPIVAAPVIGFLLGDPYTGLIVGTFLELFWADRLPIGAYIPPNEAIVAVVMTAVAVYAGKQWASHRQELIALSALLVIPMGIIGQKTDTLIMKSNDWLAQRALQDAQNGKSAWISKGHILSIFKVMLLYFLIIFSGTLLGLAVFLGLVPHIQASAWQALRILYYILPLIGTAVALHVIHARRGVPVFCAVFLVILIIAQWLQG
ncbi:MAG: PTS sugar transporter subunit IIC [Syntrophales bacterium]|jgi:PTS system mannose-specific IIC component